MNSPPINSTRYIYGKLCPRPFSTVLLGTLACIYTLVYTTHMDDVHDKPLVWLGSSLEDLRAFPPDARRLAGYQLRRVQARLMPSDYRVVKSVGPGVYEIRIHTRLEHRVLYVARMTEAVYVLHAFEKRTRQTRQTDVILAKRRFAEMLNLHRNAKES